MMFGNDGGNGGGTGGGNGGRNGGGNGGGGCRRWWLEIALAIVFLLPLLLRW